MNWKFTFNRFDFSLAAEKRKSQSSNVIQKSRLDIEVGNSFSDRTRKHVINLPYLQISVPSIVDFHDGQSWQINFELSRISDRVHESSLVAKAKFIDPINDPFFNGAPCRKKSNEEWHLIA